MDLCFIVNVDRYYTCGVYKTTLLGLIIEVSRKTKYEMSVFTSVWGSARNEV